jgi:hypothetical protein
MWNSQNVNEKKNNTSKANVEWCIYTKNEWIFFLKNHRISVYTNMWVMDLSCSCIKKKSQMYMYNV